MDLFSKIKNKKVKFAVIGLGYVGLPLAFEFARAGIKTIGIDIDQEKVDKINKGNSYIIDTPQEPLKKLVDKGILEATIDFSLLREVDALSICVPTPLRKTKEPDISFIVSTIEEIIKYITHPQLIVLESTTYPGTTEEVILPMIEMSGRKIGKDFYLAFSPERVDPANKKFTTKTIPKIIGGITSKCTKLAVALYEHVLDSVIPVSSPQVAEMIKLMENTFRTVNIALVNEMALLCRKFNIDVWEVIEGAASKPFGYMPFYPGPGLGGHCLPIDPLYLSWKARSVDFEPRFIDLANAINRSMPQFVVNIVADALNDRNVCLNGAHILILGVTYKKNVADVRESPAFEIINLLLEKSAEIRYHDPCKSYLKNEEWNIASYPLDDALFEWADAVLIVTNHDCFDMGDIVKKSKLIIDTRNATKKVKQGREKIVKI